MNKIKQWLIMGIVSLFIHNAYSQGDYIATDSSLTSGIKLIQGTARDNAQYIRLKSKNQEIKYFPEQLSEYGFKNGTVYISKNITVSGQAKKVFLERLEHGKINLYFYKGRGMKTYFLEKDSTLFVEISKNERDFRKKILENTNDFDWKAKQVKLAKYNRKSLSKLINMYNHGYNRPLPYRRFGIAAGYSRATLAIPSRISNPHLKGISFKPHSSAMIGVFMDMPIEMSYFSVNAGVSFLKSGFSVNAKSRQSDVDVIVNTTSVNLPVLLRYTLPSLYWRPFINAGGLYSYHVRNENKIYEASIDQNEITINEVMSGSLVSKNMLGYSFGIGLQHKVDYKRIVSAEIRYNQLLGNKNTLNKSQFDILFCFSF